MAPQQCPGQDTRYWKPEDIYDTPCVSCGLPMEFFKTDLRRACPHCGAPNVNPRNDMSCAAWCKSAPECLAQLGQTVDPATNG